MPQPPRKKGEDKKRKLPAPILQAIIPITLVLSISALFFFLSSHESQQRQAIKPEIQTTAERFGSSNGELSYNALWTATQSSLLTSLRLDPYGKAELLFRDDSGAEASFPPEAAARLAERARKNGTDVSVSPITKENPIGPWLQLIVPVILVGGMILVFFLWRRNQGGQEQKREEEAAPLVKETFASVAGCPEAVEEIKEFSLFLKERQRFLRIGAKMPSGAVLHGPPGTGKTLLARALAGEAGVPFYHMAGSEAVNKYVGVGASSIRKLFAKARRSATGAVIFIDEIDALGRKRSGDGEPSSREHDSTLNQLLVELDGFSGQENIVVIAATNRLDTLDSALLRPGRLSRHIPVLPPNEEGRLEILQMYAKGKPLDSDVDLPALARITAGSTGADLSHILNEAAIQAARQGREKISDADLREGHLRALAGPERPGHITDEEELQAIAYHEAGHVLCGELCPEHERAERVTIVARGQAAGMAVWGAQDRALHSPEYVRQRMIAILGGRAAEKVAVGNISSGAANDLQQANELARTAIEDWGISEMTGQLISRSGHQVSDKTRSLVDQEVEEMVTQAFLDAISLIEDNRSALESLAQALMDNKVLERVDILAALEMSESKPLQGKQSPKKALKKEAEEDREVLTSKVRIKNRPYVKKIRRALRWVEKILPEERERISS